MQGRSLPRILFFSSGLAGTGRIRNLARRLAWVDVLVLHAVTPDGTMVLRHAVWSVMVS